MVGRRSLILAGLSLLLLWLLRSFIATIVFNNVGSIRLNRALLAPDLTPEERLGWAVGAGQAFQTALAWDPLNAQAYYNLGTLYDLWGDQPSAAHAWSRAAGLNARDPSTRFALGQALATLGYEQQALQEWQAADAAIYFVNQGLASASTGDHEGALEQYQKALAITPDLVESYYYLGRTLNSLGRRDEALAALESAAAQEPASSPRHHMLQAELYGAREEWTAALVAYSQAANLSPQDPVPHSRMGWILYKEFGDYAAAISHFQTALQLDLDYVTPRLGLASLSVDQEDCNEATRWLDPLLSSDTELAGQAHGLLGSCLLGQGWTEEALAHLEVSLVLNPWSVDAHLRLAQAYVQVQSYHEAITVYLQVLELQPDNVKARQALEELDWFGTEDDGQ